MKWSLRIGRAFGIAIHLHWTFLLLLLLLGVTQIFAGDAEAALVEVVFVLAVFAAVVLHELGHAMVARRFGIKTRDITLLPIGGIARLERIPTRPLEEILVGIAGPLVNVALAAALFLVGWALQSPREGFLWQLISVNAMLAGFNLLPAFPMDGGRIFRALLSLKLDRARSTRIAARTGRGIAYGLFAAGLFYDPILMLIAIFVWFGATQEETLTLTTAGLAGLLVKDAMVARFDVLDADQRLGDAALLLMRGFQPGYPVVRGEELVGLLTEQELTRAFEQRGPDVQVRDVMRTDVLPIDTAASLEEAFDRMIAAGVPLLPVVYAARVVGILTQHRVLQIAGMRRPSPPSTFGRRPVTQP
jgi:Zn-dependent protease/CBS domain-containing protein